MLEIKNLSKSFGSRRILDSISFSLVPGEVVFFLGRSGVGKSVLLKIIVGLLSQDSGQVWIDGQETQPGNEEAMTEIRKKCGLVFQLPALLDSLTILENLMFGLEKAFVESISEGMKAIGLDESILKKYPRELSFGIQKKVSFLRTTLRKPRYLLFDEPTTGLDPISTRTTNQNISSLAKSLGAGCFIVSHDVRSAIDMGERILILDQGKICFDGTPHEMKTTQQGLAADFVKETVFLD